MRHEAFSCGVKFESNVAISFASCTHNYSYFVKLKDSDGVEGWGEGAPFKAITGDSEEEARKEYEALPKIIPICSTIEEFDAKWLSKISAPSLKAAFDIAFYDLMARRKSVPTYKLFSDTFSQVPNSVTVFIKPSHDETRIEASRIYKSFPHLKVLKIKLKGEDDEARCRAIKDVSPPKMKFILDANQGFQDPIRAGDDLNRIIDILGEVLLIEEPCPKGEHKKMAKVKELVSRSVIVADESCCSEDDLKKICDYGSAGGINVKLQKAGGIYPSRKLIVKAATHGLKVMVGQMFESSLSTAAALAVAGTSQGVVLTDLDMDLELPDFSTGKPPFESGVRLPVEAQGFGFSLDSQAVTKLRSEERIQVSFWR